MSVFHIRSVSAYEASVNVNHARSGGVTWKKRKLWRKLTTDPHDSQLQAKYRECCALWRRSVHNAQIAVEQRIVESKNLGKFFSHVNARLSSQATRRRHGRVSWWSPCLGIVWLVCTSHLCLFFMRETKYYTCVNAGGREHTVSAEPGGHTSCYYLRQWSRYMFCRVRLSVCLLARLLKNAFMDLHEMLRVDRCRDMDNFSAGSAL